MMKCGVISVEQPVQLHTRIATDAKKREFPFYRVDRDENEPMYLLDMNRGASKNDYIKTLSIKPSSKFFERRLARFVANLDPDRSEEHTSELQSRPHLVCRLLLEKKKIIIL